jgi:predicted nucleic acid-binding protein
MCKASWVVRELAVVNASPLIYLSKVKQLSLLTLLATRIVVPREVYNEIAAKGDIDTNVTVHALNQNAAWLSVADSPVPASNNVVSWDLGAGESAVIATALANPNCPAIIDDALGRKCAKTLGVELFGTLGLVLIAKQRGRIDSARSLLAQLRVNGMFLAQGVIDPAVALVGE